jgi:hypothetical protein
VSAGDNYSRGPNSWESYRRVPSECSVSRVAITQKRAVVERWAGPISDVIHAGELAIETLSDWLHEEPPCEVESALPNETRRDTSPSALERRLDTRDLKLVGSIRIRVGGESGPLVVIHLQATPFLPEKSGGDAVTLEVTGYDDAAIDGLLDGLVRIFRRGRQVPPVGLLLLNSLILLLLFAFLAFALPTWLGYSTEARNSVGGILIGVITAAIGLGALIAWIGLHPTLELLAPGQAPRRARWSLWVWSTFLALIGLGVAVYFGLPPP